MKKNTNNSANNEDQQRQPFDAKQQEQQGSTSCELKTKQMENRSPDCKQKEEEMPNSSATNDNGSASSNEDQSNNGSNPRRRFCTIDVPALEFSTTSSQPMSVLDAFSSVLSHGIAHVQKFLLSHYSKPSENCHDNNTTVLQALLGQSIGSTSSGSSPVAASSSKLAELALNSDRNQSTVDQSFSEQSIRPTKNIHQATFELDKTLVTPTKSISAENIDQINNTVDGSSEEACMTPTHEIAKSDNNESVELGTTSAESDFATVSDCNNSLDADTDDSISLTGEQLSLLHDKLINSTDTHTDTNKK